MFRKLGFSFLNPTSIQKSLFIMKIHVREWTTSTMCRTAVYYIIRPLYCDSDITLFYSANILRFMMYKIDQTAFIFISPPVE